MVFDGPKITELVIKWEATQSSELLGQILEGSQGLIEAIVSKFHYSYREDLIQECNAKVIKVLGYYNPEIGSLHNYLTTVIKNTCITFVEKEGREAAADADIDLDELCGDEVSYDVGMLEELIERNRHRFPSLPVSVIDDITNIVYDNILENGLNRLTIGNIVQRAKINKSITMVVIYSTVVYLRMRYKDYCMPSLIDDEFTLLPELKELIGESLYQQSIVVFSGLNLKMP